VKRLDDGLTLESLDGQRSGLSWHDDKGDNGHVRSGRLHLVVQASKRLDKHVDTFIPVLVTTSGEEVESLIRVKVVVSVEVASNKVVDALLVLLVEILELVSGRKLLDVQTIWQDTIWLSLEEMLAFVGSNVRNRSEDIASVSGSAFYAVPVVDASLSSLRINIEILEVVVKVDVSSTEITTEKGSVGGEDGSNIDAALLAEWQSYTSEPFVELSDNGAVLLVVDVLVVLANGRDATISRGLPLRGTMQRGIQIRWPRLSRGHQLETESQR